MRSPAPHGARQEGGAGAAPRGKEARRAPRTYSAAAPGHHGEDDEGGGGAGCGAPGQPGYKGRARRRRPGLAGSPGPGKLRPQPSLPKRARIKGKREIPSAGEEVPFWGAGRERGSVVVASVPRRDRVMSHPDATGQRGVNVSWRVPSSVLGMERAGHSEIPVPAALGGLAG